MLRSKEELIMAEDKERYYETEDEALFDIELEDLSHLVVAPEQNPYSERPMEYLGQSAIARMKSMHRPSAFRHHMSYRLLLRMPREQITSDTPSQARALISKYGAKMIEDNNSRIRQIQARGRRQLPYALTILFVCIALGVAFGLELFLEMAPITALAISEGFYIVGWIALWRPMDVLLFDPMEVRTENKLLRHLMEMRIDVVPI